LYEVDGSAARIDELLGMVGLQDKRKARVDELSGGQRQRLSITLALVNRPLVAFLDEPTTGLDPGARRELWQTIQTIRDAGTTVVLTTHYMEEAEILCDRVAVMDRGNVIALDTPAALIRHLGAEATVRAQIGAGTLSADELSRLAAVKQSTLHNGQIELQTSDVQATLIDLLALATRNSITLTDLRSTQASLEDVFLSLTGRSYEGTDEGTEDREQGTDEGDGKSRRKRRS
jgi:ABC-2 type transport system ATP-binding protein